MIARAQKAESSPLDSAPEIWTRNGLTEEEYGSLRNSCEASLICYGKFQSQKQRSEEDEKEGQASMAQMQQEMEREKLKLRQDEINDEFKEDIEVERELEEEERLSKQEERMLQELR